MEFRLNTAFTLLTIDGLAKDLGQEQGKRRSHDGEGAAAEGSRRVAVVAVACDAPPGPGILVGGVDQSQITDIRGWEDAAQELGVVGVV